VKPGVIFLLLLAGCSAPVLVSAPPTFHCTREEGYWQGRAGLAYTGWCTPDSAAAFQDGHQSGRELYELYRRRAVLEQDMNRIAPDNTQQRDLTRREVEQVSELIRRLERR